MNPIVGLLPLLLGATALAVEPAPATSPKKNNSTPSKILHISDFGARGDGQTDDGPAFAKAMAALTALKEAATLQLGEKKTYRIATLPETARILRKGIPRGYLFPFNEVDHKTMDGNGSYLVLRFPIQLINIDRSANITVRGFSFTFDPLPFTQGYIQAINPDAHTLDVKVEPGFPLPKFDAPEVQDNSRAWDHCWTFDPACYVKTKTIKEIDAQHTAKGIFRVLAQDHVPVKALMKGSCRIIVPTLGIVDGVPQAEGGGHSKIANSKDILLEDLAQHSAPQFSFSIGSNTGKIEIRNVDIKPPEGSGHWFSAWRDGFHIKANRGPIIVEDCDMAWLRDDCLNISANPLTIEKTVGPKAYQFRVQNREPYAAIEPGFTIEGWNKTTGKYCGSARVVEVRDGAKQGYWTKILVLDQELKNVVADGETTNFWCHELINAGSVVRNNRFDGSVRFRSPGLYENNEITSFMILKPELNEGPLTCDMVFRGNILPATTAVPTTFGVFRGEEKKALPPWDKNNPPDRLVRRIVFENNILGRPINLFDAADVTFRGNKTLPSLDGKKVLILRNTGPISTDVPASSIKRLD
jgi:hypothetical protein